MSKHRLVLLIMIATLLLGGLAMAVPDDGTYSNAPIGLTDLSVAIEDTTGNTAVLYYDDGKDDTPRHGWRLNSSWSYQVRFNPPAGKKIKIGTVNFYIADVFSPGTIEVHVQSGIDETFAAAKVEVSNPGWYKVELSPGLETDSFFYVVLKTRNFDGGGGDDQHPPTANRSAQGSTGHWNDRNANFMVHAIGEQNKVKGHKVAVLICGDTPYTARDAVSRGEGTWDGGASNMKSSAEMDSWGYDEFWSDTVRMYRILIEQGGFHPDNIYVLWGDGVDWSESHPDDVPLKYQPKYGPITDYAATLKNVQMVFDDLTHGSVARGVPIMTKEDSLFVWTFDHGTSSGGGGAQSGDSWLCLMDGNLSDYDFAKMLHGVPYAQAAVFMQQCFSGGFIDNVANKTTFIATASRGDEGAWRADDVDPDPDKVENETWGDILCHHGEFNYYFMNAFEWRSPLGTPVNANIDDTFDGRVSSKESFTWAFDHDSRPETPQVRDDGGVGADWILTWKTTAQ